MGRERHREPGLAQAADDGVVVAERPRAGGPAPVQQPDRPRVPPEHLPQRRAPAGASPGASRLARPAAPTRRRRRRPCRRGGPPCWRRGCTATSPRRRSPRRRRASTPQRRRVRRRGRPQRRARCAPCSAIVHDRHATEPGDALRLAEVATPPIGPKEVLVQVHAASVDRSTWHLMAGQPYPMRLAFGLRRPKFRNPGRSVAGTVAAVAALRSPTCEPATWSLAPVTGPSPSRRRLARRAWRASRRASASRRRRRCRARG